MADEGYRHYYGYCEEDGVLIQIEVGPDRPRDETLPEPVEWYDAGLRCPVCGNTVPGQFDGADDWTTDDEKGRRVRAEGRLRRVQEYADQCGMLRVEPSTSGLRAALPPGEREVAALEAIPEAERTDEQRLRLRQA